MCVRRLIYLTKNPDITVDKFRKAVLPTVDTNDISARDLNKRLHNEWIEEVQMAYTPFVTA